MWFLENAWLVPLIPAVSFVVILLFGKRLPRKGSEVGIVAVGASFVLSCGAASSGSTASTTPRAARAAVAARSVRSAAASAAWRPKAEHGVALVEPVTQHIDVVPERRRSASAPASRSTASP